MVIGSRLFILGCFILTSARVLAVTSGASIKSTLKDLAPKSYSASLSHSLGARDDSDPVTSMAFGASFERGELGFSIVQPFVKYYVINDGEAELQAADTVLSVKAASGEYGGFATKASASLTLPVSKFSKDQGVLTKIKASVVASRSFLQEKLSYSVSPAFWYHVNKYTTTVSGVGEGGGYPLLSHKMGVSQSLSYEWMEGLHSNAQIAYIQQFYHDIGYRNRVSTAKDNALLSENYSVSVGMSYKVSELVTADISYDQSSLSERTYGVREYYLFDEYSTQYIFSLSSVF